jgi:phospholipid N-methyltransferase
MLQVKEIMAFLKEGITNFHDTGTFCATSKWAAKALTNPLREIRSPQNILELGSGTGSVTIKILQDMIPGDKLTICEINPRFMGFLKKRLAANEDFIKHKQNITFFEGPVQELPEKVKFDVIVCALPFLNFDVETVQEIFSKLHCLSNDDTVMTYYQYIGLRKINKIVSPPERKKRILEISRYFDNKHLKDAIAHERVWLNILPIHIYTLKLETTNL